MFHLMGIFISVNKQEKYHQYILDDLVQNTGVNELEEEIFITGGFILHYSTIFHFPNVHNVVSDFFADRYGLRKEESQSIWERYVSEIKKYVRMDDKYRN